MFRGMPTMTALTLFRHQGGDAGQRIGLGDGDGFQRMRQHPKFVAHGDPHPCVTGIYA